MAAITLGDCRTIAKALLNEKGNLQWTTSTQNTLANMANRYAYGKLIQANKSWVGTRTSFTWPASTERIDLSSGAYLGGEPLEILDVYETPDSGAPSDTNPSTQWMHHDALNRHAAQYTHLGVRLYRTGSTRWHKQADFMYATPVPQDDVNLHIEYVPQVAALTTATTAVLSGLAEAYGDLVAVWLAKLMNTGDNRNPEIDNLMSYWEQRIFEDGIRTQRQRNHVSGERG